MGYIDQIRSFLPSIEQDDKASVYVSVQHLREIVDFADNAQSFANDATALLEKAETERKQQDILVAELTQKVIDLQSGLSLSEQALDQFREEAARLRTIARALMPYRERQDQIGNIARIAYDILNPAPAEEARPLLYEADGIKLYRGDKLLVRGDSGLYVLKLSHKSRSLGELVADSDWHLHYESGKAFIGYRKAYLDYLKEHGDIDIHPYSGEVITAENHARISEEIEKLRKFDEPKEI